MVTTAVVVMRVWVVNVHSNKGRAVKIPYHNYEWTICIWTDSNGIYNWLHDACGAPRPFRELPLCWKVKVQGNLKQSCVGGGIWKNITHGHIWIRDKLWHCFGQQHVAMPYWVMPDGSSLRPPLHTMASCISSYSYSTVYVQPGWCITVKYSCTCASVWKQDYRDN